MGPNIKPMDQNWSTLNQKVSVKLTSRWSDLSFSIVILDSHHFVLRTTKRQNFKSCHGTTLLTSSRGNEMSDFHWRKIKFCITWAQKWKSQRCCLRFRPLVGAVLSHVYHMNASEEQDVNRCQGEDVSVRLVVEVLLNSKESVVSPFWLLLICSHTCREGKKMFLLENKVTVKAAWPCWAEPACQVGRCSYTNKMKNTVEVMQMITKRRPVIRHGCWEFITHTLKVGLSPSNQTDFITNMK